MYKILENGITFSDVLLVPNYSEIQSREFVNTSVQIKDVIFNHPIVPANMKSVMSYDMAKAIVNSGGLCIYHRFCSDNDQLNIFLKLRTDFGEGKIKYSPYNHFAISVGTKDVNYLNVQRFIQEGGRFVCIDIAHGDSSNCIETIKDLRNWFGDKIIIIAGNIATSGGAKRLWDAGADVVKSGIGSGCFAAGTRVLMSNGLYKNIEDIVIGDRVINKDGNPVVVKNAICTGTKKVIKFRSNSSIQYTYVTPDHQYLVGDLSGSTNVASKGEIYKILDKNDISHKEKYKWLSISENKFSSAQTMLLFPKQINFELQETFKIQLNKRNGGNGRGEIKISYCIDSELIPTYDLGYIFGTFLGDGTANCCEFDNSKSGRVFWYFGKNEIDIANKLIKCIKNTLPNTDPTHTIKDNMITVSLYYKPLADYLFTFGKKDKKYLPTNLLVNNLDYLTGIYDGLLDSDGYHTKDGRDSLSNTSINVIELFNVLSIIVNKILPSISIKAPTAGNLKNCNIANCKPSYISRIPKTKKFHFTKNYQIIRVYKENYDDSIELELPVYDIEVECDTHSFIANNTIVHNSICSTRTNTGNGVPQLSALIDVYTYLTENKITDKYIIADGGITNSGDIVKALCFSHMIMSGGLFSACDESSGELIDGEDIGLIPGVKYKSHNGSSTHKTTYVEGAKTFVKSNGKYNVVLSTLLQGVRSGCSYQGVNNLVDLREAPVFIKISSSSLKESGIHGVDKVV